MGAKWTEWMGGMAILEKGEGTLKWWRKALTEGAKWKVGEWKIVRRRQYIIDFLRSATRFPSPKGTFPLPWRRRRNAVKNVGKGPHIDLNSSREIHKEWDGDQFRREFKMGGTHTFVPPATPLPLPPLLSCETQQLAKSRWRREGGGQMREGNVAQQQFWPFSPLHPLVD